MSCVAPRQLVHVGSEGYFGDTTPEVRCLRGRLSLGCATLLTPLCIQQAAREHPGVFCLSSLPPAASVSSASIVAWLAACPLAAIPCSSLRPTQAPGPSAPVWISSSWRRFRTWGLRWRTCMST